MTWKVQEETQLGLTLVSIIYLITLYIIVCSANILCIWNWALNWASFLIDRFVDSVISQSTACFHQKHSILVIFLYLEKKKVKQEDYCKYFL